MGEFERGTYKSLKAELKSGTYKGIKKLMVFYLIFLVVQEGLALYFPMLLQDVSSLINKENVVVMDVVWKSLIVLVFIILISAVNFITEYFGAAYADKYQGNLRKNLFEKFNRISPTDLDELGAVRALPMMMNDTTWLKNFNRRMLNLTVFFPVAIVGSFVMLFWQSNYVYALFAAASVPIVVVFFMFNARKLKKLIPPSVDAYDEYFLNVKEGITGAKDIRILGKAEERSEEFAKKVKLQRAQGLGTDKSLRLSEQFNMILFSFITVAIILYGTLSGNVSTAGQLVFLNTAVQYINKIWSGSHTIFTWFVDYLPREGFTWKRLAAIYKIPDEERDGGLSTIPVSTAPALEFKNVHYLWPNNNAGLSDIRLVIPENTRTAIAGGIGSGRNIIANLLLRYIQPTEGQIIFNSMDIAQINTTFWRKEIISFCSGSPKFIPATIRENMKLLAPNVTDAEILKAFKDIGANDFVKKFGEQGMLDFVINERSINDSTKNLLNLVRAILKPAQIYIFNQCFEHIRHEYITKLFARLRAENKTALFISYEPHICKHCDGIHILKNGKLAGFGTHKQLAQSNKEYQGFIGAAGGVILRDEKVLINQPAEGEE